MKTYHSSSSEETKEFGELLAEKISNNQYPTTNNSALIIALQGDLGAGKTTFTQGFFKGLGIRRRAISPTFVIMRKYAIPAKRKARIAKRKRAIRDPRPATSVRFAQVYHLDAYRLKNAEDLAVLEFGAIFSDPKNIILIEWPERIKEILPKSAMWLKFQHGKKENERTIRVMRPVKFLLT